MQCIRVIFEHADLILLFRTLLPTKRKSNLPCNKTNSQKSIPCLPF